MEQPQGPRVSRNPGNCEGANPGRFETLGGRRAAAEGAPVGGGSPLGNFSLWGGSPFAKFSSEKSSAKARFTRRVAHEADRLFIPFLRLPYPSTSDNITLLRVPETELPAGERGLGEAMLERMSE